MRRKSGLALGAVLAVLWCQPSIAVEPDDQPWDEIDRVLKESPATPAVAGETPEDVLPAENDTAGGPDRDPEPGVENDRLQADQAKTPAPPATGQLTPTQATPTPVSPAPAAQEAATPATAPPPAATAAAPPTITAPAAVPPAPVASATAATDGQLYLPVRRFFETKAAVMLADFEEADRTALLQFYDTRMGQALWVTRNGFNTTALNLIAEIGKASDWGLASEDYKAPGLTKIGVGDFPDDDLVDAEVKLSLVAMQYARHARGFRIFNPTEQLSSYIDRQPQLIEPPKVIEALAAASDKGAYLRGLHPQHPQFERLREKLLALRAGSEKEEFEKIPSGPKITPGKSHWHVGLVRLRLKVPNPGMKPDGTAADQNYYDATLSRAVLQFKEKNGITPLNTTISAELRTALNTDNSVSEEILLANMEQWRWMPADLGGTHIFVNVPEFLVRVVKSDAIIHEERIVTGRYETQTPIFSDQMRTVVFQPSWNVPESIKINELLPKLRAGGNPIERQGLEIKRNGRIVDAWDINWNRSDIRNYHVYQPPGDSNVLGVVKFLFPNKHAVYLHDTPSKRLFNEKVRTFSHGCMRVRNPVQLAEVIMAEDKGWDKRKVNDLVNRGPEDNDIALDRPMPVHVTYFTAWVDNDGEVKTYKDIYGHQKRIILGLEGRWGEIVKNRDHMLPPDMDNVPVARNRDDWGDSEGGSRRLRQPRYTYQNVPPPPGAPGYKKPQKSVGDLLQSVFGGF